MMSKAMVPIWILSWLVLLPIDSVGTSIEGKTGLDRFTFGNISTKDQHRLWAHLIMDIIFISEQLYFPKQVRADLCTGTIRLDTLSHLDGDAPLADSSTEIPHLSFPFQASTSEHYPCHRNPEQ